MPRQWRDDAVISGHWTQDDLDALCEIVDALCDLTDRVVQDRGRGHEQMAQSIKARAQALRNKTLG